MSIPIPIQSKHIAATASIIAFIFSNICIVDGYIPSHYRIVGNAKVPNPVPSCYRRRDHLCLQPCHVEWKGQQSPQNYPNLQVMVAESLVIPGERGLFLQNTQQDVDCQVDTGQVLCGYSKGEFVKFVKGSKKSDKAVGFYLESSSLVVYRDEVMPLHRLLLLGKEIRHLAGHQISYYAPFQQGVRVSVDESMDARSFVPLEDASEWNVHSVGKYANDLAFSMEDMSSDLAYRERSYQRNHFVLCWKLIHENDSRDTLVPDGLSCVTLRRFAVPAGETIELGCYYGMEFWRELLQPQP